MTQYNNAAVGSGTATDQVRYAYDGWGNLTTFEQDVDGVIGAGGRASFAVSYVLDKVTPSNSPAMLERIEMDYPDGFKVGYTYNGDAISEGLGRVTSISDGTINPLVSYSYLGAGQLVQTTLEEAGSPDLPCH